MYLGIYRFEGNVPDLLVGYDRMMQAVPPAALHLHVCVPDDGGLWVYDACPTREVFERFAASADFRALLADAGLPPPQVRLVGDVHRAIVGGERRV
jgi:hypothetical protein